MEREEFKDGRLTIYVSSPKSYEDVFDVFFQCFQKFWKYNPYPFVFSTNYDKAIENVLVINSHNEKDSWIERTIPVIKSIKSKYILLFCDDLFLTKEVINEEIEHIIDVMDRYNIDFCRLKPCNKIKLIEGENYLSWTNKKTPYGLNLQCGIYNREYLLNVLGDGSISAWAIEDNWLKDNVKSKNEYFNNVICVNKDVICFIHGVRKGLWFPSCLDTLKKMGIRVTTNKPVMSSIKEHYVLFLSKIINTLRFYTGFIYTNK